MITPLALPVFASAGYFPVYRRFATFAVIPSGV